MDRRRFLRGLGLAPFVPIALKGMDWSTPPAEALPVVGTATASDPADHRHPPASHIPPGTVLPFVGEAPEGWLLCDGRPEYAKTYPKLYAAIGTTYGTDGNGTFKLPDMRVNTAAVNTGTHSHHMETVPSSHTHTWNMARADHNHTMVMFQPFHYWIRVL